MRHGLSLLLLALGLFGSAASAQTLKVLTAGAIKPVVMAFVPGFQSRTGVEVVVQNDTAGGLLKRIQAGEAFDVVLLTAAGLESLSVAGKVDSSTTKAIAKIGIGVAVKTGTTAPSIGTVDQFKSTLLNARKVAYIDPASGGSSGIYLQGLFQRLGIDDAMKAKAVLVPGGLAAARLVSGEADLAVQQASELMAVDGATLVGMLPEAIQNYTTYGFAIASGSRMRDAAEVFVGAFSRPAAAEVMRMVGIQPLGNP